jgi:hypothetical protein
MFSTFKDVGVEIVERDNYITQGCSLHSFKSSRGVGVEIVEKFYIHQPNRNKNNYGNNHYC